MLENVHNICEVNYLSFLLLFEMKIDKMGTARHEQFFLMYGKYYVKSLADTNKKIKGEKNSYLHYFTKSGIQYYY